MIFSASLESLTFSSKSSHDFVNLSYIFLTRQFFLDPRVISFLRRVLKFNYGDYGKHVFSNSIFILLFSITILLEVFFNRLKRE